jgi:hypothetical protein
MSAPLALALLWLTPGWAQPSALAWSWPAGEIRAWHVEITRERVDGDWHKGALNLEARAIQTNLAVDLVCQAGEPVSAGWVLDCRFPALQLSGTAFSGEEDALRGVFAEYRERMADAVAHVEVSRTGRIRSFDLDAFTPRNAREAEVEDCLRMLMIRPFALLELELPRGGDDKGRPWRQGGSPLVTQLRTSYGTSGGLRVEHRVTARDGARVSVKTEGRGTVAYGLAIESDGAKTIGVDLVGHAEVDLATGALLSRDTMLVGRFTAGAAGAGPADHFREIGSLALLPAPVAPAATPP